MSPLSTIVRAPGGTYLLKMQGHIPHPHWVAFLFAGLAQAGVSVASGRVAQNEAGEWQAQFCLDFRSSSAVAETLDYVALSSRRSVSNVTAPLRLTRFTIVRRREGTLETQIEGPDQAGFLGRVLGNVALLGLFPSEMDIDTQSGTIKDRMLFRSIGGTIPPETVREALQNMLKAMLPK